MNTRHRGFTLIEAVVVLAIVGILAAMAVPSFTQYSAGKRMRALVSDFSTSVRLARSEALKRNRVVTMCRSINSEDANPICASGSGDWRDGWIVFEDSNADRVRSANETIVLAQAAKPTDGSILVNTKNNYTVSFTPMGTLLNLAIAGVEFRPNLANPDTSALRGILCINASGRIRFDKGTLVCTTQ